MAKPVYHPGKDRAKIDIVNILKTFRQLDALGHGDSYLATLDNQKTKVVVAPSFINHMKDYIVDNDLHEKDRLLNDSAFSVDNTC